jgi:hypothetical protein
LTCGGFAGYEGDATRLHFDGRYHPVDTRRHTHRSAVSKRWLNANHFDWLDLVNVDATYPGFAYFLAWTGTPTVPQSIRQNEHGAALLNRAHPVMNRNDFDRR